MAAIAPQHNDMRFDINLAHIYPMVETEEINLKDLIRKVRQAITDTIDRETEWCESPRGGFVRTTGGDGCGDEPLHDEVIAYDFS